MSTQPNGLSQVRARLNLEYPMSLGTFEKYEEAQKAVDTSSDQEFPVQNCLIVGTDLKQLERMTGRLTCGRVCRGRRAVGHVARAVRRPDLRVVRAAGRQRHPDRALDRAFGAVFGLAWAAGTVCADRRPAGLQSVSHIVPSKYEVLVEHKFAQQARDILGGAGLGGASHGYVPTPGYASDAQSDGQQPPANQP